MLDNISTEDIKRFCQLLASHFTNFEQSQREPSKYAHINIYFRPLRWDFLKGPCFYSEQSFSYDKWLPYRQSIIGLRNNNKTIILDNYKIYKQERYAGSGFRPDLLEGLNIHDLTKINGCSIVFKKSNKDIFEGQVESGKSCIVYRGNHKTYLFSKATLTAKTWKSIDEGYDVKTEKKIWGSENGELIFNKVADFSEEINISWSPTFK